MGDTGVAISRVGFGCASLMRLASARQRANLIAAAIDAGLTHFDVARMYGLGSAETELGRALRGRRDAVTIATKFGIDVSGAMQWVGRVQAPARALLARSSRTRTAVRRQRDVFVGPRVYDVEKARTSLDTSLRKLSVDHVDILFLHDPRSQDEIDGAGLTAFLEGARAAGKIRGWGMSLDDPAGVGVLSRLPDHGIVQMRRDVLAVAPSERGVESQPGSIAFGTLSALAPITDWLTQRPDARRRWSEAIGVDPLERDLLPGLLLEHTLNQAGVVAALYSTTQVRRLAIPSGVTRSTVGSAKLDALARCIAEDRDSIVGLAGR